MGPERFRRIRSISDAALRCSDEERDAFLKRACQGDDSLLLEVEKLLSSDGQTQESSGNRGVSDLDDQTAQGEAPPLSRGTVLCERYEVLSLLGRGGMGAVYKARDRELTGEGRDEVVAVKTILPRLSNRPELLRRFKDEVFLARHITHRNVVRIFDLQKDQQLVFLTMEFVVGDDLETLLATRGPYSPEEAAEIISQIASGLEAAHHANVIHRDLKSRNVMVEVGGRVVVMDFGLARVLQHKEGTETVGVLGTPGYMPPEQLLHRFVDHRSDLYSLGVVFYELVTGELPYERRSTLSGSDKGRAVTRLHANIPQPLDKIIRKCLADDPDQRYQSARDLITDLDAWRFPQNASKVARAANTWRALALACAVLLVGLAVYLFQRETVPIGPHPLVSILIADFENRTGDSVFSGGTLESVLSIALESAPFITSYNRGTAHKTVQQLSGTDSLTDAMAHQIAVREEIHDIVTGSLTRKGSDYHLVVNVIGAGSTSPLVTRRVTASSKEELLAGVNKIGAAIRKALGERKASPQKPETFTASSIAAIHAYAVAQELALEGKFADAIPGYLKAIQLDPNLGRAYAGLAALYRNHGQIDDALKYYGEGLKHINRMTDREKYRTRGGYYITSRNVDKAIEEYSQLVKQYPSDNAGFANLALAYFLRRDMAEALDYGRRAVAIYPKNVFQRNNVALYAMYAGDFKTAIDEAREVLKLNPSFENAFLTTALSQLAEGHIDEATETYGQLQKLSAFGASRASMGLADIALYEGRAAQAIDILKQGYAADLAAGDKSAAAVKLAATARAYLLLNRGRDALVAADQALSLGGKDVSLLFPLARIFLTSRADVARGLSADLARSLRADDHAYAKLIDGELALRGGNIQSAIVTFSEAKQDADTWMAHLDLARAYVAAGRFTEADTEADTCMRRRGEATAIFLDDVPTYRYFPDVYYFHARAEEGLTSPAAKDLYRSFLLIKQNADNDPLVADARARVK